MTRSYYWDKVRFYKQLVQENDKICDTSEKFDSSCMHSGNSHDTVMLNGRITGIIVVCGGKEHCVSSTCTLL